MLFRSKVVVRTGRENSLCLLSLEEEASLAFAGSGVAVGLVARWAMATRDGDLGGDFPAWLVGVLGTENTWGLSDRRGECIYSACKHYKRCFIERSHRRARRADMVIANHALVLANAARADDGREMPKDPEPRWWGTSVGKWVDDFTFVAQTAGVDDRTWLDNAGRPHSDAMRVVETYHRRDADHLEMTIVIDDPKFYTKPWTALDNLSLRKQPKGFVLQEMECSPSETAAYNKRLGDPGSKGGK